MASIEGVRGVVVDTTARAHIRTKKGVTLTADQLNGALKKARCSVKSLSKKEMARATEILEIKVKGMG